MQHSPTQVRRVSVPGTVRGTTRGTKSARGAAISRGLAALVLGAALAHAAGVAADAYRAPRGPGGEHPDLNGIWQALSSAHYDIERHAARSSLAERPGPVGPVPSIKTLYLGAVGAVPAGHGIVRDGVLPYLPDARARQQDNRANWLQRDPEISCYLPGIPRSTYMPYPFQILQGADSLFVAYEYAGAVREIYLEDPGEAPIDSWMGQSVGRWEGDTLVVTVTAQNDQTWFDRAGNHHSAAMVVTERFTPMGPNHLRYEARIEDPQTFTRPWTIELPLYRRMEADARLLEFRCVEFVEELMYGEFRREPLPR